MRRAAHSYPVAPSDLPKSGGAAAPPAPPLAAPLNILYNVFRKVKYHYNLIEAVNSLFFTISSSSTMFCLQIEGVEIFWNILDIEIGMSVPKTAKFLIM